MVKNFAISKTLGYLTADNADSCDLAVNKLFQALLPDDDSVLDLTYRRRIRCVNYELNLSAIGFLDGTLKKVLKKLPLQSEARKLL